MSYYVGKKRYGNTLDAQNHFKQKHKKAGKTVKFVPVCAFGIIYSAYLVDEDAGFDWPMDTPLGDITYAPN